MKEWSYFSLKWIFEAYFPRWKGGGGILNHGNCRQIEINTNWQKFGLFKKGPVKKGRRQKTDNMFRASVCLKIAGEKKEDDLMFNELSFNFN